jgi:hypothetical protein
VVCGVRLVSARSPAAERAVTHVRIVVDVTPLALPRTGIGNYVVAYSAVAPPGRKRIENALDGVPVERRLVLVPPRSHYWRTAWSRIGRGPIEWVAYPGLGPSFRPDGPERDLGGPFLLTVATLERRQNLETLL